MAQTEQISTADLQRLSQQLKALQKQMVAFQSQLENGDSQLAERELAGLNKAIGALRADWRHMLGLSAPN